MKNLGNQIKQFREKHGFTQKELGEKLGVSAQAVSKWENNVNQPDISTIRSLCGIFGIGVDEFLQEKEPSAIPQPKTTQTAMPNPRKRFWIIFCAVALAFVVCFLCIVIPLSLRDKKSSPPSSQDNAPLSSNDIYKKADPSVFFIEIELENGNKQAGSGFFIDDKGTAVTNYHVVQGGKRGKVILADGKEYALKYVLGKDKHSDLVAIQIDIENSTPVTLADSLDVETGDRVYAIGYPESFLLGVESSTFTEGIVSKASYTLEGVEYIQTNADITHGNSGGVLLNDKAEVVGITTGTIQINGTNYMNLALPANNILRIDKTEYVLPLDKFTETLREYTVHFMNADLEYDTRKVLSGERVEKINSPVPKTGYTFTSWHTDKNATLPYDFERKVTEDLWLYAGWQANRYTLTFAKGAENATGAVTDITAEYDQSVTLPDCGYELTDYRFIGWADDENTYQAGDSVKNLSSLDGDILTLTAVWEKIKTYTLTFDKGESEASGSVADITAEYDKFVTLPDCGYELTDYRFMGWAYDGNTYQAGASVKNLSSLDGDILTLTAVWEKIKKYTIFFEMGRNEAQGTLPSSVVVEVGKDYILPQPSLSCKGWDLSGWQLQGGSTVYAFNASVRNLTEEDGGEVTLVAVWKRKTYDICLDFGSETDNRSYKVSYGDTVTLPSASEAEKEGYFLTGWQWNGTTYPAGAVIEDFYTDWHFAEFKAIWQGKTYSVKYIVVTNETTSEFIVKEEQFVYGSGYQWATEIDGFEKEGYRIAYWQWKEQNKQFTAGANASPLDENATVELYAVTRPITFSVIILDVNGDELRSFSMQYGQDVRFENCVGIATDKYYYAKTATILSADKTEYTGDPRYACTQQDGTVYLKPDWQENVYSILFTVNWVDEKGEQHSASMNETGNLLENTESTYWITLAYSQEFILPTPTVEGYSFHGWDYYEWPPLGEPLRVYQGGDTIYKFTENVGYNFTPIGKFVAKLTPYQYVVRYDGNGAQLGSMRDQNVHYGEAFAFAKNGYTKSGCTLGGWLLGDTLYFTNDTPYFVPAYDGEVITLKAYWISYEGAGTQENPYLISSYEDLFNLSVVMKEKPAFRSAHYLMTTDIDCQGKILYSIGAYTTDRFTDGEFTGVFDGGLHIIKNALFAHTNATSQTYKGLFGQIRDGTVKNLGIVDYSMEQTASYASAPLVAQMFGGSIENCYAVGNLSCPIGTYTGGLIGCMTSGTVKNCKASGVLSFHYEIRTGYVSTFYIGGFVGGAGAGTFEYCYTDADILLTKGDYQQIPRIYLGSFAGEIKGTPTSCIATSDMDLPSEFFVSQYDAGDIFHGKFAGGLRRLDGSLPLWGADLQYCYLSADAIYNVEFAANDNVTTKSSAELNSLSWLKENLGFDDTVWAEKNGEVLLSAFLRSGN